MDKELIEFRSRILSNFCKKISKYPYIFKSEEMQIFLMNTIEPSKIIDKLPELQYSEILIRFTKVFDKPLEDFDYSASKTKVAKFFSFIKKTMINLQVNNIHIIIII